MIVLTPLHSQLHPPTHHDSYRVPPDRATNPTVPNFDSRTRPDNRPPSHQRTLHPLSTLISTMLRITSHPLSTELATLPGISPTVQLAISHAPSRPTTNTITLLHITTCVIAKHTKKAPSTARAERKRFGGVSAARANLHPTPSPREAVLP